MTFNNINYLKVEIYHSQNQTHSVRTTLNNIELEPKASASRRGGRSQIYTKYAMGGQSKNGKHKKPIMMYLYSF